MNICEIRITHKSYTKFTSTPEQIERVTAQELWSIYLVATLLRTFAFIYRGGRGRWLVVAGLADCDLIIKIII